MAPPVPVLVGAGERTVRALDVEEFVHPVELMASCARAAAEDAESRALLERVDSVHVINIYGWNLRDAPAQLAERLGLRPALREYTAIGGNAPQWTINRVADRLAAGRGRVALLAGCEVLHSISRAAAAGVDLGARRERVEIPAVGDDRPGSHEIEIAHHADLPVRVYPILENALRAAERIDLAEQRRRLGRFGATHSAVAAANPRAWFPVARSADEVVNVTPGNRMVAWPYTKLLNAIMNVDQGAALLMTTDETARALGIPEDRWTWLHGGQDAHDLWYFGERPALADSVAIPACVGDALRQAGLDLDAITDFDLYSCFPCMPRLTRRALGLDEGDPRPMTLAGGLPYFGGPGSNYTMHAVAAAMRRCRADRDGLALVTANGWYCTKHAAGIYGGRPSGRPWSRTDPAEFQRTLPLPEPLRIEREPRGAFLVDGYTVCFERDGRPGLGILCGRTGSGDRAWAHTPPDADLLRAMTEEDWVGRTGRVTRREGGVNIAEF